MNNQRQQHDLQQGSQAWHEFRAQHIGASEIAAVLGLSKYTTRTELLRIKATGIAPDVDSATQRVFDRGHETEAMARPIAESIVGEELYPTTWSYGVLSASCDGLTAMDDIGWEHKQFNKDLFELVSRGELPDTHMPQVQQCLLVTGADKWLFMVSDGTEENCAHMWVYPDIDWFERIEAAAEQFYKDLEAFQPEPKKVAAQATLVDDLLLPSIVVTGEIAVETNLELFGEALHMFLARINHKPETDEDFANVSKAIKSLEKAEEWLDKQEENAIARFDQLNQAIALKNSLKDLARENRLMLQKIDKAEKENRKNQIVLRGKNEYAEYRRRLQAELPIAFVPQSVDFAAAIKGKKTLSSMQDAVGTELANAKIGADALARDLREKHAWYIEHASEYSFLFSDLSGLIYLDADAFKAVAQNRIAQHKEQERIKADQQAKAQAEREEQIRKDAAEKAAKEERERIEAEQKAEVAEQDGREKIITQAVQEIEQHQEQLKTGFQSPIQGAPEISKSPGRKQLIQTIANKFFVTPYEAEQWLAQEFGRPVETAA